MLLSIFTRLALIYALFHSSVSQTKHNGKEALLRHEIHQTEKHIHKLRKDLQELREDMGQIVQVMKQEITEVVLSRVQKDPRDSRLLKSVKDELKIEKIVLRRAYHQIQILEKRVSDVESKGQVEVACLKLKIQELKSLPCVCSTCDEQSTSTNTTVTMTSTTPVTTTETPEYTLGTSTVDDRQSSTTSTTVITTQDLTSTAGSTLVSETSSSQSPTTSTPVITTTLSTTVSETSSSQSPTTSTPVITTTLSTTVSATLGQWMMRAPIIPDREEGEYKIVHYPYFTFDDKNLDRRWCSITDEGTLINKPSRNRRSGRRSISKGVLAKRSFSESGCWYWQVSVNVNVKRYGGDSNVFSIRVVHIDGSPEKKRFRVRQRWYVTLSTYCPGMPSQGDRFCLRASSSSRQHRVMPFLSELRGPGTSDNLTIGVLLDLDKRKLNFIDVKRNILSVVLDNIDVSEPIWPVFKVFYTRAYDTELTLETGSDIPFSPKLINLIGTILIQ